MNAALRPLAEMRALEARLAAALEEAKKKLEALKAAKSESKPGTTASDQRIPPGQEPQWWLLGPILNGPLDPNLAGGAGSATPPPPKPGSGDS